MTIDKVNGNRPESVPSKNVKPYKGGQDKLNSIMNKVQAGFQPNENEHFMPPIKEPLFTLKKAEDPSDPDTVTFNVPITITIRDTIYVESSPTGDEYRNPDY